MSFFAFCSTTHFRKKNEKKIENEISQQQQQHIDTLEGGTNGGNDRLNLSLSRCTNAERKRENEWK